MSEIEANAVLAENEVPALTDDTSTSVEGSDATEVLLDSNKKENDVKMDSGERKRNVDTNIKPEMTASTAEVDKKVDMRMELNQFFQTAMESVSKHFAEGTLFPNNLKNPNAVAMKTNKSNLVLSGTTETAVKVHGAPNSRAANLGLRTQSMRRYLSLLIHASQCNGIRCQSSACQKMKRIIQHTRISKGRTCICTTCKQIIALCYYHAKYCKEKTCSVPFCQSIKSKLRQHQLQKSTQQQLNGVVPSLTGIATSAIISVIDSDGAIVGDKTSAATVMDGNLTIDGKGPNVNSGKAVNIPIVDVKEPIAQGKGPIGDGKVAVIVGKGLVADGKGPITVDKKLISTGKGLISDGKIRIIDGKSYEDIEKLIVEGKVPEGAIVVDEIFIEADASIIYSKNVVGSFFGTKEGEPEIVVAKDDAKGDD